MIEPDLGVIIQYAARMGCQDARLADRTLPQCLRWIGADVSFVPKNGQQQPFCCCFQLNAGCALWIQLAQSYYCIERWAMRCPSC